jgi:hypothetical protein
MIFIGGEWSLPISKGIMAMEHDFGDIEYTEYQENVLREGLAEWGLCLLRSGKKPGTNDAAYKMISASRLTMVEATKFVCLLPARRKPPRFAHPQGLPRSMK